MVNSITVLQTTANVSSVSVEVDNCWNCASLRLGMSDEERVKCHFVTSLQTHKAS